MKKGKQKNDIDFIAKKHGIVIDEVWSSEAVEKGLSVREMIKIKKEFMTVIETLEEVDGLLCFAGDTFESTAINIAEKGTKSGSSAALAFVDELLDMHKKITILVDELKIKIT